MNRLLPQNSYELIIYLLIAVTMLVALALLIPLSRKTIAYKIHLRPKLIPLFYLLGVGCGVVATTLIYGQFIAPDNLQLSRFKYDVPTVFLGKPVKIAVIADLQKKSDQHYIERVVNEVNATLPDLIFWLGDLIQGNSRELPSFESLAKLRSKYGNYAILGNHDYNASKVYGETGSATLAATVEQFWTSKRFIVLRNQVDKVTISGVTIGIAGSDSSWVNQHNLGLLVERTRSQDTSFNILLVHEPEQLLTTGLKDNFALALAAHCHGGQVTLGPLDPLLRLPLLPPGCRTLGTRVTGEQNFNGLSTFVTTGLGHGEIKLRIGRLPEIMMIELE